MKKNLGITRPHRAGSGRASLLLAVLVVGALVLARPGPVFADEPDAAGADEPVTTFLDHDRQDRLWFGAQANSIFQYHPSFPAAYSGKNSLRSHEESALSGLITAFLAYAPTRTTEGIVHPEMALGGGLSDALGAAGFPNLDVVRNPTLSHEPYIGRLEIHQVIPLSRAWVENEDRGPLSSFKLVPKHRLELRIGKMSTADLFDINPAGSDSHLQFMNWSIDNNGAFDYAADTRGYTYAVTAEYKGPRYELRLGEMLMPKVANGIELDWDVANSRGENLEAEIKQTWKPGWRGAARLLLYQNHANMGSYAEAVDAAAGTNATPDITAHRKPGRTKRGIGINVIQQVAEIARLFGRFGWSDGKNESFAYTEIDNTIHVGGDLRGTLWCRPVDKVGLAFVSNGISSGHRAYLKAGGLGFLLGDGRLTYARETIVEQYYNAHVWRGFFLAEDVQLIANPGYNSDRGPAWVFSLRAHVEL